MKKQIFFNTIALIIVLMLVGIDTEAGKWRVNNTGGVDTDFTSLAAAHTGASNGDTIYIESSGVSYGTLTITKKLCIFGPGYFLPENPETQANPVTAKLGDITLGSGSDSTILAGLEITYLQFNAVANVNINNVVIMRNKIGRVYLNNYNTYGGSNNMIIQNYIEYASSSNAVDIESYFNNTLLQNNYISSTYGTPSTLRIAASSSVIVSNNVIRGNVQNQNNTIFENNIFINATLSDTTAALSFDYNIANTAILPYTSVRQIIADLTTIFNDACATCSSTDGQYQVEGAAIGYANDGTQCGMFGGSNPYVLSGLPPIPAIFEFKSPSAAADSLSVTIKIKSHK